VSTVTVWADAGRQASIAAAAIPARENRFMAHLYKGLRMWLGLASCWRAQQYPLAAKGSSHYSG